MQFGGRKSHVRWGETINWGKVHISLKSQGFFLDDRKQVRKTDKIVNLGTVNRDTTVLELILSYYAV